MLANAETIKRPTVPLPAILGLDRKAPGPKEINRFFFKSPLIAQRLSILNNMVGGRSLVIVVIGERGSGKTTLMNEFISTAGNDWQACRIKLTSRRQDSRNRWRNLNNRMVFRTRKNSPPSIIIDDAHQLSPSELKKLLQSAYSKEGQRKFQSIVLFAEPAMRERFAEIARWLPPSSVIDKIFMTPFTEKQTADYLKHRLKAAGLIHKNPFSVDQVRKIYQVSGGLPGWINGEAFMLLRKMETHHKGFKRSVWAKMIKWQLSIRRQCKGLINLPTLSKKPGFSLK